MISQFIDKAVDVPVVAQRQIRMNRKVQKTIEISQLRQTNQMVHVLVVLVAQVPQVQVATETAEIPVLQVADKVVDVPVVLVVQAPLVQVVAVGRAGPTCADRGGDKRDPTVAARGEHRDDPRDPDGTGPFDLREFPRESHARCGAGH